MKKTVEELKSVVAKFNAVRDWRIDRGALTRIGLALAVCTVVPMAAVRAAEKPIPALQAEPATAPGAPVAATTPGDLPSIADFQKLLGKPDTSPEVKAFVQRFALREYTKGPSGGFENYRKLPFSLLYEDSKIDRVVLYIAHGTGDSSKDPTYTGALPSGIQPTDTPEDVLLRLGPADAQPERDNLFYDKPPMVLAFDRTTHRLVELDLDAQHHHATDPTILTREIGEVTINYQGLVVIPPQLAAQLFDATPTRLRQGWQDHLPSPPARYNQPGGESPKADTSKYTPPASTEPRAHVSAYNTTQLFIDIYRPAGNLNGQTYEDNILEVCIDRTPALDKLFDVLALERAFGMVYRGLRKDDTRGKVIEILGEPEKIEPSAVKGASTLIYAGGAVHIELSGNNTINAIRLVPSAAATPK